MPVYNVLIGLKSRPRKGIIKDNISENELLRDIVEPYDRGEDFRCDDEIVSHDDISNIKITESERPFIGSLYQPSPQRRFADRWQEINQMKDVTDKFIKTLPKGKKETISNNVFIVHGRDHDPMKELKAMLSDFGLNPVVLHEQPSGSRTIVEKLEKYSDVGYAFVILTPDDVGGDMESLNAILSYPNFPPDYEDIFEEPNPLMERRARQNVILEFGYFIGLLGRDKVCCLHKGDVELPSDMHGIVYIPFKESVEEARNMITKELKAAGYEIKV
jgi:predicted nucleotide-binding protein